MECSFIEVSWGTFAYVACKGRLVATFLPQARRSAEINVRSRFPSADKVNDCLPAFRKEVLAYFKGGLVRFKTPVDVAGLTPFRQAVLLSCSRIPFGKTATYADLAAAVGRPAAVRAVGSTMAHNPLPLVVPCHRVLRSDGGIGGFSSPKGVREKLRLLRHEAVDVDQLERSIKTPANFVSVERLAVSERSMIAVAR